VTAVLFLNQDWQPLAVARVPRALVLIGRGKAEALLNGVAPVQTPSCTFDRPAVIRLLNFVKRPRPRVRYTRQNIFKRDGHQCQYCGGRPKELTVDHVLPLSRGGRDWWDNVVAACTRCNHKKAARTPEEAHMVLKTNPAEPRLSSYLHLIGADTRPEWLPFLPAAV
jgi:5-methylcytosine-specific restriction endonuclease McrA